ncbi:uncharacterized protein LOC127264911 [Andrographis paniculata]|uniref:uncharacterized protein LOC127264911 n=1 Tax=Andrographis paniculata TaxID=175694 RepID=UPI0021E788A1|nr:uncharacterized protein LOC127264911 [Andrographis paniculata]
MNTMALQNRSSVGAEAVLGLQPNSSVSIAYHPQFGPHNDLMLLEVDEKLLQEILHQRVTLRGQPDEDAVLCTPSKTYAVKFVGSSNSVFLIPPSELYYSNDDDSLAVAPVLKVASGCMELVEAAPKLDKLKFLLNQNPYSYAEASEMEIPEEGEKTNKGLYRWEDLLDRLQASDEELRSALQSIPSVEINGYWRIVDEQYMNGVLNMLLHNIVLNDWSMDALDEDEVVRALEADGFPRSIAEHCLRVYSNKLDSGDGERSCTWKLDEKRVCVKLAREILRERKIKIEMFMEKWRKKAPEGMNPSFDMLEGEVLVEKIGMDSQVYLFRVSDLPSTPAERFSILFKERAKWEWKDLEPYVRDLKVPGLSSEGLLLKYSRRTQPTAEAEPIFSSR